MLNAITIYRVANWLWKRRVPVLPQLLKLVIFLAYNSSIPYQVQIGRGSMLAYGGIGVVIHRRAQIGGDVVIGTGVTIGGRSSSEGVPRIGSHVYLATGAKVLGDITIGDYVVIGANAVVVSNVPSFSVVAGVPAKVLRTGITAEEYQRLI